MFWPRSPIDPQITRRRNYNGNRWPPVHLERMLSSGELSFRAKSRERRNPLVAAILEIARRYDFRCHGFHAPAILRSFRELGELRVEAWNNTISPNTLVSISLLPPFELRCTAANNHSQTELVIKTEISTKKRGDGSVGVKKEKDLERVDRVSLAAVAAFSREVSKIIVLPGERVLKIRGSSCMRLD